MRTKFSRSRINSRRFYKQSLFQIPYLPGTTNGTDFRPSLDVAQPATRETPLACGDIGQPIISRRRPTCCLILRALRIKGSGSKFCFWIGEVKSGNDGPCTETTYTKIHKTRKPYFIRLWNCIRCMIAQHNTRDAKPLDHKTPSAVHARCAVHPSLIPQSACYHIYTTKFPMLTLPFVAR